MATDDLTAVLSHECSDLCVYTTLMENKGEISTCVHLQGCIHCSEGQQAHNSNWCTLTGVWYLRNNSLAPASLALIDAFGNGGPVSNVEMLTSVLKSFIRNTIFNILHKVVTVLCYCQE